MVLKLTLVLKGTMPPVELPSEDNGNNKDTTQEALNTLWKIQRISNFPRYVPNSYYFELFVVFI